MSGLFGAFLFEVGLITYRAVTQGQIVTRKGKQSTAPLPAPLPSLYTSAILVYGVLGLVPNSLAPLPALVGWGFVVATFLNLYTPGAANAGAKSNAAVVQGLTTTPPVPKTGVAAPISPHK
jgi:hypothetical protein